MYMLRNATKPLKIQILDLAEEAGEIGQARELSAEDLNLVAGGLSHACVPGHQCIAGDM
jgi:hypothetical protein